MVYTSRFAVAEARSNASLCVGLKSGSCPRDSVEAADDRPLGDIAVKGDVVAVTREREPLKSLSRSGVCPVRGRSSRDS